MSDWMETLLIGMAMTAVFFGLALLIERAIIKRIRAEREQERRNDAQPKR